MQGNPIPSFYNFPRDLGISKFIAPSQFPFAQDRKVQDKTEAQEKNNWNPRSMIDFSKSFLKQRRIPPFCFI